MAPEIAEHHDFGAETIRSKEIRDILDQLKQPEVSTVVLVGDPGTGKTWMAREICRLAIEENLCHETLWVSLTDDYKPKTIPKYKTLTKSTSLPKEKTETMIEESAKPIKKIHSMPEMLEESESKTFAEADSMPKHMAKTVPEKSETETVPEDPKSETTLKAEIEIMPEESKTETMPEAETETPPEDSKAETMHWESATKKETARICGLLEDAIASKMFSQSSTAEEWEAENTVKKDEEKLTINEMVRRKLDAKGEEKKYDLLLVLDQSSLPLDESRTNGNELWKEVFENFKLVLHSVRIDRLITLVTRRKVKETATNTQHSDNEIEFEVGPLSSEEESMELLKRCLQNVVSETQHHEDCLKEIASKSNGLPAAITMIAKAIAASVSGPSTVERAIEKAAKYKIGLNCENLLLHCAYVMLPTDVLKLCFCHSLHFFSKYGGIHYTELIAQWILEGYFDSFHHIKQKHQKGHAVLMELINRGMLKIQEENIIVAEGAALKMIDCLPEFLGKSCLGLAGVSQNDQRIGLGRITQIDGMIKTICDHKKWEKVSTLLIDGDRLRLEVDDKLFVRMKELEALAIFNSGLPSLLLSASKSEKQSPASPAPQEPENPSMLEEMSLFPENSEPEKLPMKLLVLRSCDLLNDITHIEQLKTLTVLEISGASSLKKLPERLFDEIIQLKSLNLSGCQMGSLHSLSKLTELRFLILRECSSLMKLPRIKDLQYLEIIDLSGATSLTLFPEQDLSKHEKLQMIDLSRTQIKRLPKFGNLQKLSRISIEGCKQVFIIPSFQNLGGLKILHLSGVKFCKFHKIPQELSSGGQLATIGATLPEPSHKELATTPDTLTEPSQKELPLIPATLSELHVRDCPKLEFLPHITHLTSLEVLDVSGASDTEFAISDKAWGVTESDSNSEGSSHKLEYLREINLSNTKLKELPSLNNLVRLRKLLLKNCSLLEKLPEMKGLENLEELDLSGCSKLHKIPNLKDFSKLKVLYISETGINPSEVKALTSAEINPGSSQAQERTPSIRVNDADIFHSLKKNPELKGCIKQISTPLCPPDGQVNLHGAYEVLFSDFYLLAKSYQSYNNGSKFLEIRRLERFFTALEYIFKNMEFISLVEHMSMKSLADLDAGSFTKMKGCWIARCLEMESIITEKTNSEMVQNLDILWVSNLPKLTTLFRKTVDLLHLTHLHLDCCPNIKCVFSSSQIPKNLQVLRIKFCDSLETVYKMIEDGPEEECTLSNLQTLLLFELPKLTRIGFKMSNKPLIWECPNLKSPPTPPIKVENGHLKFSCRWSTGEIKVVP